MDHSAAQSACTGASEKRRLLNEIYERRAKAGKLVAGVAAKSNSDLFKATVRPPTQASFDIPLTRKPGSWKAES